MLELPKSTQFSRRVPKQKFYENLNVSPALKRVFVEQIKVIYWRNKISPATVNLSAGRDVTEIEVFEVRLNSRGLDESVLRLIDRGIPYHILFLLEHENIYQAWIGYKEESPAGPSAFKVNRYFHTPWLPERDLPLRLEGLTMDDVYGNFVRQVAGDELSSRGPEPLSETVERAVRRQELEKRAAALREKVRREKQFNKQVRLNDELKALKKELEEISDGSDGKDENGNPRPDGEEYR